MHLLLIIYLLFIDVTKGVLEELPNMSYVDVYALQLPQLEPEMHASLKNLLNQSLILTSDMHRAVPLIITALNGLNFTDQARNVFWKIMNLTCEVLEEINFDSHTKELFSKGLHIGIDMIGCMNMTYHHFKGFLNKTETVLGEFTFSDKTVATLVSGLETTVDVMHRLNFSSETTNAFYSILNSTERILGALSSDNTSKMLRQFIIISEITLICMSVLIVLSIFCIIFYSVSSIYQSFF